MGDFTKAIKARTTPTHVFLAQQLIKSWKGWSKDEYCTARILARFPKHENKKIAQQYFALTGKEIRQAITENTSDNYTKALITYLYEEAPGKTDAPTEGA